MQKVVCLGPSNVEIPFERSSLAVRGDALDRISEGKHDLFKLERHPAYPRAEYTMVVLERGERRVPVAFDAPIDMEPRPAGSALNVAAGLRRVGVPVTLITPLPSVSDFLASGIVGYVLREQKMGLRTFPRPTTPVTLIVVDGDGCHVKSMVLSYKPLYEVTNRVRHEVVGSIIRDEPTHMLATGIRAPELPIVENAFRILKKRDGKVFTGFIPNPSILAPGSSQMRYLLKRVLQHTDVLQMNVREAATFLGITERQFRVPDDVKRIGRAVCKSGVRASIITRGADGACLYASDGAQYRDVEAYPCPKVIDTTGAGDAFFAAYTYMVSRGCAVPEAFEAAAFAAAGNVAALGGHGGMPNKEQLERFLVSLRRRSSR